MDFVHRLRVAAERWPNAIALIEASGERTSYATLVRRVANMERGLVQCGMQPGDRVLFAIRPSAVAIAAILAITNVGAVVVAAPIGAGDELFSAQMRAVNPKWVLAESMLIAAMGSALVRRVVRLRGGLLPSLDALRSATLVSSGVWLPGLRGALRLEAIERLGASGDATLTTAEGEAFIVFTSGSTAAPKAVVHSRASLASTIDVVSERLGMHAGDRLYARDLHLVLPALLAGGTAYVPRSGRFDAKQCARALGEHGITHLFEVTANLQQLVDHLESHQTMLPDTVRRVMVGAAPVRPTFFRRLQSVLPPHADAWCVYGMTEMLPIATIELRDKLAYAQDGDIVGHPVSGAEVRTSASGELMVRGTHLFKGYLGSGDTPAEWHPTGDLARIDADGRIVLLGRAKDMIIRGEHNIYPELHESVIEQIAGVKRCALVGVFDETAADERIVLVIEPEASNMSSSERERFIAHVRACLRSGAHRIDDAAQPDAILVAVLPVTIRSGKVDKAAVRAMAQELLP